MTALDDFTAAIEATDVMQEVLKSLKEEPALLLGDICRQYERTGEPVPDHHLQSAGYMGEATLRALVSLGWIKRQSGGRRSLYCYEPTSQGREQYEKLKADGFYNKTG